MDKLVSYSESNSEDENSDEESQEHMHAGTLSKKDQLTGVVNEKEDRKQDSNITENKRKVESEDTKSDKKIRTSTGKSLPLPDSIKTLFKERDTRHDDSLKHDGRVRSFPHTEGNWATYIYIPYEVGEEFLQLVDELMGCLRPLEFKPMTDFHVSLSRTVSIRHHWIPLLTESLRRKTETLERCHCGLSSVKLYTNDEKTRTFLAVQIESNFDLNTYTEAVNESLKEFNLQSYYKEPSYHISIAWCLGDVVGQVSQKKITELQEILSRNLKENPELEMFHVSNIMCKTGNKHYCFQLELT